MRCRLSSFVIVVGAGLAFAHAAGAQRLAGTVRDSVSRLPVSGVIVILLDATGGTVSRNLTNERGEYRVRLHDAARRARFVRIGFSPLEVSLPSATDADVHLDATMFALPSLIQAVHVRANSQCKVRKDRAEALGLWEQARAGLLATIVAREENPAKVVRLGFYKMMDGNSDRIERMRVESDSADGTAKTYVAAHAAADFVRLGFSTDSLASATYFGPDADVLLNDAFAGAYCFELAAPVRARPNQVGLRFVPADHRKGRVDIDGTLWIDSVARELRDVEYRYLNVEAGAVRFKPGGYVSFRAMKNGVVMIDRWWIRVVSASTDTTVMPTGAVQLRDWLFAEEDGGELARAQWPDGLKWKAPLGSLRLRAVRKDGKPAAGTIIGLVATHYFGTADDRGMVEINELLPGPYTVRVIDPRIAELGVGLPTALRFVAARDTTSVATLTVPTTESMIADRCVVNHQWAVGDSLFTMGRVVTPDGKPVNDAKVTFATRAGTGQPWQLNPVYFTTGTDGMFEFCHPFAPPTEVKYRVARAGANPVELEGTFTSSLLVVRMVVNPLR
ncbi:MAG TPA: hypothetical protein VF368_06415 [Gemmatimonadaceae bacterium]